MGQNNFFKWITVPPVVAIATVFFAQMMGGGNIVADVDLALWALIWLLFIVLSFLYGMFYSYGNGGCCDNGIDKGGKNKGKEEHRRKKRTKVRFL